MISLLLRLAARVAYSGARTQRWRQVSVLLGSVVLTCAALLSVAAVSAARTAEAHRVARLPIVATGDQPVGLLMSLRGQSWQGRQFPVLSVAPGEHGRTVLPPGLKELPAPGTAVLSPGLRAAGFATDAHHGLGLRRSDAGSGPGGVIGAAGLASDSEWLAYTRPPAGRGLGTGGALRHITGFGPDESHSASIIEDETPTPSARAAEWGTGWLFLLPSLFLALTCTAALSSLRSTRARTLHRLGLSRWYLRALGAAETAMLAAPAVGATAIGYALLSPSLHTLPGSHLRWLPKALVLSPGVIAATALACLTVVLTAGAGTIALPNDAGRPSGRKVREDVPVWKAAPVLLAFALLIAARIAGIGGGQELSEAALVIMLAGLPWALPWLVQVLGDALARLTRPALWLAGRRLGFAAIALARPAAAVAALILVAGAVTGILRGLAYVEPNASGGNVVTLGWRDPAPGDTSWLRAALPEARIAVVEDQPPATAPAHDAGGVAPIQIPSGSDAFSAPTPVDPAALPESGAVFASCPQAATFLRSVASTSCRSDLEPTPQFAERFARIVHLSVHIRPGNEADIEARARDGQATVVIAGDSDVSDAKIWRATNSRLPAVNLTDARGGAVAPEPAQYWLGSSGAIGCLLLLLGLLQGFGNRVLALIDEDRQLLRVALDLRQVRAVQRCTVLAPLAVAVLLGAAGALAFTWAADVSGFTRPATGAIVLEAGGVAVICTALVLLVGRFQSGWTARSTTRPDTDDGDS